MLSYSRKHFFYFSWGCGIPAGVEITESKKSLRQKTTVKFSDNVIVQSPLPQANVGRD
jgi:hypothetical protein